LRPGDLPLLRAYCVAVATWEEAIVLLSIDGNIIDNKVHPARRLADEQAKLMMSLAGKLRLCPSSRIRADSADLHLAHEGPTTTEKTGAARFFT
ncbi:MAG: P27 family phage terminase small subunit, partial [Dechloromonas sp.]|nr:P27 family phage terminase small subunit [Dechloromonas sp.]